MEIDVFTGGYFQTNGYLMSHSGGRLLIDAPEGIAAWLAEKDTPPDALLLTHLHYDHVIDAAAVQERFGCPIWAHSEPDADLTLETVLKEAIGWPFELSPFAIDRTLAEETEVEIAGLKITLLHVPGHSPDSLCFAPEAPEKSTPILFGGDVLFRGGIGRTDFPHGSHPQLLSGIREKVFTLPEETIVYPGHGPETTVGTEKRTNPYVPS